jgi:hypothetical protein
MPGVFANDEATIEHLVQEVARPLVPRRKASTTEFARAVTPEKNRRRAPRVNLVRSEVVLQIDQQVVTGVDFSLRGLQFRSATRLVPGSTVLLNIRWRDEKTLAALARVMWATFEKTSHLVDPHYRVGVSLEASDFRAVRELLERCGLGRTPDVEIVHSAW